MQNSLNKDRTIVEFTSKQAEIKKGATVPSELMSSAPRINLQQEAAKVTPLKATAICVVKKDGTREPFDDSKIVNAVKKSATRALVQLTDEDLKEICDFVDNNIIRMNKQEVSIADMHNLVEGALEHLYPNVAQSLSRITENYVYWRQRKLQCRLNSCFN